MSNVPFASPVEDSVPKVDGEVAVGEDLEFQRRWWRFERIVWIVFALLIVCDLLGLFGRGPLAKAQLHSSDGALNVRYERIERTGTPSMMVIQFGPAAVRDGKIQIYVSSSVVEELGAQRIIPSPIFTSIGSGGLTYTFPATTPPATVTFALQPRGPGRFPFTVQLVGAAPQHASVVVVP